MGRWGKFALFTALFMMVHAHAETFQSMATITNDRNSDIQYVSLALDGHQMVEGLRIKTQKADAGMSYRDFSLAQIESANGVVLDGDQKHKALLLQGTFDSNAGQAQLVVTYLSNGLLGKYQQCKTAMVRNSSGRWQLINIYKNVVAQKLFVKTWALGIKTIEGICP